MPEPVVVTGLGAVSGLGVSVAANWRALRAGEIAIRDFDIFAHARHRTHVASQVKGIPRTRLSPRHSRADAFALHAAAEALDHARLGLEPRGERTGVFFGTSTAGMLETERAYAALARGDARTRMRPLGSQPNSAPGDTVARRFAVRGPVLTISSACVSGALALAEACRAIQSGEIDVALAGGADGLCELTFAGFNSLRAVDEAPCAPFSAERRGLSLGEGAGVLVLESLSHARARGATVLCELAGTGATCDAHHMSAPANDGEGAARAIRAALAMAGLAPEQIDFVNAHGTGTPQNDAAEAAALATVFGARAASLPLTSTKAQVGHLLGSAGAFEALVTVLCLVAGEVHPTPGRGARDPALLVDLVSGVPRKLTRCEAALSTNLAFGGANAALVFRKVRA